MANKVAGLYIKLSSDSAEFRNDMKRITSDVKKMGNRVNRESNRIKYAFNKIRRAAQVVASAFIFVAGIKQLSRLVTGMAQAEDSVKLLQARFNQFARTGDSFTRVYKLSKELGVSLDETANGMTRLLVATKSMGTAQPILEDVYKNIVILGRAGGTSAEEMKGAMRQLSQGLASGRLQGEELRSVLENLPLVAMEIADQMGIGIGQIRQYAKDGKITGEVVVEAMREIGIAMEDLPQTWSMQTENLRTEWTLFLADLSKAVDEAGLLKSLTEAVKWVRLTLLGGFGGVPTEIVRSRREDQADKVQRLRRSLEELGQNPDNLVIPPAQMYGAQGVYDPYSQVRAVADAYKEAKDRLAEYNKELKERATQEDFAAKAAAGREAAKNFAEEARILKTIPLIDADDRIRAAWKRINENFENIADTVKNKLGGAFKQFTDKVTEAQTAIGRGISLEEWQAYRRMLKDELIPELENVNDVTDKMSVYSEQAARNIQDAFAEFLFDPFEDGVKGMLKSFLDAIRRMIANQAAASFFQNSGLGSWLQGAFGGGRAMGGPVSSGTTYLVGERGPELFTPSMSGNIIPNGQMGGSTTIYNIEAGADVATIMAEVIPALERTRVAAVNEVIHRKQEGRL